MLQIEKVFSALGYVPQEVILIDDTISANIAFGVGQEKINHDAVVSASKVANLHDFVINELKKVIKLKLVSRVCGFLADNANAWNRPSAL